MFVVGNVSRYYFTCRVCGARFLFVCLRIHVACIIIHVLYYAAQLFFSFAYIRSCTFAFTLHRVIHDVCMHIGGEHCAYGSECCVRIRPT